MEKIKAALPAARIVKKQMTEKIKNLLVKESCLF
jgi:hypothetical protein